MSVLSERLKELRLEGRLEQQEVADAVKISKSSLQRYENGIQAPTRLKLEALANFYQVSIPYLQGETDDKNFQMPDGTTILYGSGERAASGMTIEQKLKLFDAIEKAAKMHDDGKLTDEEFRDIKEKILK